MSRFSKFALILSRPALIGLCALIVSLPVIGMDFSDYNQLSLKHDNKASQVFVHSGGINNKSVPVKKTGLIVLIVCLLCFQIIKAESFLILIPPFRRIHRFAKFSSSTFF